MKLALFSILIPTIGLSADPTLYQKQVNQLLSPPTASNCCPDANTNVSSADPCIDLFRASCTHDDGSFKMKINLEKEMDQKIKAAFQAALSQMGEGTVEEAYFKYLKKSGYEVRNTLSEEDKKSLLSGNMPGFASDSFSNFQRNCSSIGSLSEKQTKREKELLTTPQPSQEAAKTEILKIYEAEIEKVEKKRTQLTSRLMAAFERNPVALASEIFTLCSDKLPNGFARKKVTLKEAEAELATSKDASSASDEFHTIINPEVKNLALPKECETNFLFALHNEAVDLHRNTDPVLAKEAEEKFLQKHSKLYLDLVALEDKLTFLPTLIVSTVGKISGENFSVEYYTLKNKLETIGVTTSAYCSALNSKASIDYRDIHQGFFERLAKSKPVVESIISNVFNDKQYAQISSLFKRAHEKAVEFVEKDLGAVPGLKGNPLLGRMLKETKQVDFYWLTAPKENLYKKEESFPLPILDFGKIPTTDEVLSYFEDSSLSGFKTFNAHYRQKMTVGDVELRESIVLQPMLNLFSEVEPIATLSTIAHEIGHRFSPRYSRMNGVDLEPALKKFLDCLGSKFSVRALDNQIDEAVADWISARIIGKVLLDLPEAERKSSALAVAGFFCYEQRDHLFKRGINTRLEHPETTLRINGIYGVEHNIRTALGCKPLKKEDRFRECQLDGEAQ